MFVKKVIYKTKKGFPLQLKQHVLRIYYFGFG